MKITGVDVFGFVVAATAFTFSVVAITVIQPAFLKMFSDFGGALPWITRLMLVKPPTLVMGVLPAVLVGSGVAMNADRTGRVVRVGAAALLTTLQIVVTVVAMYVPIWSIAGEIK